uniref:CD226 molecule n=1 Tax=Strigops habroptila TaxID=2489341 RepID=A0A672U7B2_STRHB
MDHSALVIAVLHLCLSKVAFLFLVKLECIYPKRAKTNQASWMKLNVTQEENIAVLHPIYGIHIEDKYKGRIYFENASREGKSLSFIKSTLQDVGMYFHSILTYPDGIWEKVIEIILPVNIFCCFSCFSTNVFEVSLKQNNPMFTKPGGNIAFTCPYKIGDSVQQVMWERIKADQVDTVVLCSSSGRQSFGSDFKERTLVDCSDQANSKIVIQNIATGRNKTCVMGFAVFPCFFSIAEAKVQSDSPITPLSFKSSINITRWILLNFH